MALAAKLQMRQSQGLVMTPQLMQSIRLLQFTHHELERFIDDEIEKNPLIERSEEQAAGEAAEASVQALEEGAEWFEGDLVATSDVIAGAFDSSLENVFPDDPGPEPRLAPDLTLQWRSSGQGGGSADGFDPDDTAARPPSLREMVAEQITHAFREPAERLIALELADELDEAGYCRADLLEICRRLAASRTIVTDVLRRCQGFEPAGLFARDLAECLVLQLARKDRLDPAMAALIGHLDLLARRDFQALRRICRVDNEDLLDMLAEIRALDPKPGSAFAGGTAETVTPDVLVRPAADGSWAVELNPETLPRVLVDQAYFARVSGAANKAEKEFLAECLQNANWLTRSLDQRAKTILKVTSEIVRQQDAFLLHGVRHLRPLNLRTVADAIGMHESTVSRVTANKYVMTPRGMFELRFFFTASIASAAGGEAHSSEAVRDRIRGLIEQEGPADALSDDAIVDLLRGNGVDIARRTVAKYRESMSIPSSVHRRREKLTLAAAGR